MTAKEIQLRSRGLTLLYAEDEQEIRDQTLEFFKNFFDDIDAAVDGQEALELFEKKRHDVIVTDLKMPKMGGEELLEKAKAIHNGVITVAMSGISGGDEKRLLNSDYYVKKPASTTMLLKILEQIVTGT